MRLVASSVTPMPTTCCDRPSGTVSVACSRPNNAHRQGRPAHAGPQVAAAIDGEPAGEGADGHDALDAEIEHAGPLADQLTHVAKISGEAMRMTATQKEAVKRISNASIITST
ncbi:hypothetical protein GCM10023069_22320 [Shinella granuli]